MPDEYKMNDEQEFKRLLNRLADGSLEKPEISLLESLLLDHPERQALYLEYMRLDSSLLELGGIINTAPDLGINRPQQKSSLPFSAWVLAACAIACLVAVAVFLPSDKNQQQQVTESETAESHPPSEPKAERPAIKESLSAARIIAVYRAVFRGSNSSLPIGSRLRFSDDYMLQEGLIKIHFPSGAETILSAPAQFRIVHNEKLAVNLGNCSVYAPAGAEGFEVSTPTSEVIDLGTRFSVAVSEDGSSNVAVVDGEAEISSLDKSHRKLLLKGDTASVGTDLQLKFGGKITADHNYVTSIPDRLISYDSTVDESGRAMELTSLYIQRGGVDRTYYADELILPRINHYLTAYPHSFGMVPEKSPSDTCNKFGPMNLVFPSGFTNPGGAEELHQGEFILGPDGTPGMNVVFDQPIINSPGPDLVIFEAQLISHVLEGDVFHLYPQTDQPDAKPITVSKYDIDGHSAEARVMSGCRLTYISSNFADDGTPLPIWERSQLAYKIPFRVFAVSIDLSDMNIPPGAKLTGLFIQDAVDDIHRIDPVVIVGLPPVK